MCEQCATVVDKANIGSVSGSLGQESRGVFPEVSALEKARWKRALDTQNYRLQQVSKRWVSEAGGRHRSLLGCSGTALFKKDPRFDVFEGGVDLPNRVVQSNIFRCNSKWSCPVCSNFQTWKYAQDIGMILKECQRRNGLSAEESFVEKLDMDGGTRRIVFLNALKSQGVDVSDLVVTPKLVKRLYTKGVVCGVKVDVSLIPLSSPRKHNYQVVFSTLTGPHKAGDFLRLQMGLFSDIFNKMVDSKPFRRLKKDFNFTGYIRCFDHTVKSEMADESLGVEGQVSHWHTHMHVLFIFDADCDLSTEDTQAFRAINSVIKDRWDYYFKKLAFKHVCKSHALKNVLVDLNDEASLANYVTKVVSKYVTKNENKKPGTFAPFDLLAGGDKEEDPAFYDFRHNAWLEFVSGTKKFHRFHMSKGLRAMFDNALWHKPSVEDTLVMNPNVVDHVPTEAERKQYLDKFIDVEQKDVSWLDLEAGLPLPKLPDFSYYPSEFALKLMDVDPLFRESVVHALQECSSATVESALANLCDFFGLDKRFERVRFGSALARECPEILSLWRLPDDGQYRTLYSLSSGDPLFDDDLFNDVRREQDTFTRTPDGAIRTMADAIELLKRDMNHDEFNLDFYPAPTVKDAEYHCRYLSSVNFGRSVSSSPLALSDAD